MGIFVISDESASTITAGLNLLKSVMPSGAFYSCGYETGPELILNNQHSVKHLDRCGLALDNFFACSITCKGGGDGYGKRSKRLILKTERHYAAGEKLVYASSPLELSEIYHDITILLP